jgi:hypothetical protein
MKYMGYLPEPLFVGSKPLSSKSQYVYTSFYLNYRSFEAPVKAEASFLPQGLPTG